jgi:hypothetical protein
MAAELCGRGSVVEHHLAKVRVASSNLVARSGETAGQGPNVGPAVGVKEVPCPRLVHIWSTSRL